MKSNLIICGDVNVNYLQEIDKKKSQLNALLNSYNLFSIVQSPTRTYKNSITAIGNIFIDTTKIDTYEVIPVMNGPSHHDKQIINLSTLYERHAKMADDMSEGIDNALNLVVNTVERSGNMKKELKETIYETVSSLRNLFAKLKDSRDSKLHTISDLEGRVTTMKAELQVYRKANNKVYRAPSLSISQARIFARGVAPPGGSGRKLYLEALGNEGKMTRFKITVTSKENQTLETIKEIFKSKINPTEIKVGINNIKVFRNGKVLIETNTKEEMETLGKDINTKFGDKLGNSHSQTEEPQACGY